LFRIATEKRRLLVKTGDEADRARELIELSLTASSLIQDCDISLQACVHYVFFLIGMKGFWFAFELL